MSFIINRYNIVGFALTAVFCVIIFQLVNLQIIEGAQLDESSQYKLLRERRVVAPRGNIFDRNGIPIATNRLSYNVEILKTKQSQAELNEMLLQLTKLFEKNNDLYKKNLSKYLVAEPFSYGPYLKESEKALKRWKKDMANNEDDIEKLTSPKALYEYLRDKKFSIDKKYSIAEAYKIMNFRYELLINGYTVLDAHTLANDVSVLTIAEIEEKNHLFPGVTTDTEPKRTYLNAEPISHVLGYVANLNGDEYELLKDKGYYMTDYIGKLGIEEAAEETLRGTDGTRSIEVDIWGRQFKELYVKPAVPGDDVTLTIDMKLQEVAVNSLKKTIQEIRTGTMGNQYNYHDTYFGSVVAIDVNSGEVLAMASHPSFDPKIFLADKTDKEAQKSIALLYDPKNVETGQYNRCISGTYPPGSTFKPLVGLAGLEEGIITKNTYINDPGSMTVEGVKLTCLEWRRGQGAHGQQRLKDGLRTSCNMFFYNLGIMTGINNIDKWSKTFGLGEKTGIEISGERRGVRATPEFHKTLYDYRFGKVLTAQASIGQSYNLFSPLQLANYCATLANGGKKYEPHLIKSTTPNNGTKINNTKINFNQIDLKENTLDVIREGMVSVTTEAGGTAAYIFKDFPYTVAAKTGTAQTFEKNHSDNGVFIAFAPAEKPKLAIAIIVERGVYGSYTAPIARDIFNEYFKLEVSNNNSKKITENGFLFTE